MCLHNLVLEATMHCLPDVLVTSIRILSAAQGGSKIQWKGLYAGLGGNIVGVLPASAIFVGVYEPAKRKLLELLPENLSAIAHLVSQLKKYLS